MNKYYRLFALKTLAQNIFNIRNMPNFKENLFSIAPNVVNDLNDIANIINNSLLKLTENKANFNIVWTNPSVGPSQFTDDVKNLIILAKYLYSIVSSTAGAYSKEGLKQISVNLLSTLNTHVISSEFKDPIVIKVQNMMAKFNTV